MTLSDATVTSDKDGVMLFLRVAVATDAYRAMQFDLSPEMAREVAGALMRQAAITETIRGRA